MKHCDYCGKEAADDAPVCRECGRPFSLKEIVQVAQATPSIPEPKHIKADAVVEAFSFNTGFHRADWGWIGEWIDVHVPREFYEEAWNEAVLLWTKTLRDDLGGNYYVSESHDVVLLCDLDLHTANWLLHYADATAGTIRDYLGATAWQGAAGKNLVLLFADQDDYYQYISFHSPDGEQAASGGVCIHSGYTHIALPWQNDTAAASVIAHELTHDCLSHLELPLWLNEGMALTMEGAIAPREPSPVESPMDGLWASATGWRPPIVWDELADRHFSHWNSTNIQTFWAGTSFYEPGDPNELSYSLARILIKLLSERAREPEHFRTFIEQADRRDAGQDAAMTLMRTDLGAVAAEFLGPGGWRPDRRRIQEAWKSAGWEVSVPSHQE